MTVRDHHMYLSSLFRNVSLKAVFLEVGDLSTSKSSKGKA